MNTGMFNIVSQKNRNDKALVDIRNIVEPTPISFANLFGVLLTPQQTKHMLLPTLSVKPNYSLSSFLV